MYSLSQRYGINVELLLSENDISNPSSLSVGMKLVIPGIGEEGRDESESTTNQFYTVVAGDTYYSIARKHELSVDELLELNERDSRHVLMVGEILILNRTKISDTPIGKPQSGNRPEPSSVVVNLPGWPVAGIKKPLNGKLVGVSIEADPHSYVYAVSAGNVVWTGPYRGFGNVALIDSDGYIYLYGGNEDLFVNVGQDVSVGNRIGRLGEAGAEGGKREMYFSVFKGGIPVSPEDAPRG